MSWGNPSVGNLKQAVNNGEIPSEGPKVLPFTLDFTVATTQTVDLSQQNALKQISFIQGAFIDNRLSGQPFYLTVRGTGQVVKIPAGAQGYVPVLATLPNYFDCASAGGVNVTVLFYNMPMPLGVWSELGAFQFDANGYLEVSAPDLNALIDDLGSGNGLNVNVISGGSSAGVAGLPTLVYTTQGAAATNATIQAVGPTDLFRLTGLAIYMDNNMYDDDGNSGFVNFTVYDGVGASVTKSLASWGKFIPPTPPYNLGNTIKSELLYQSPPGFLYESTALGNDFMLGLPGFAWDQGLLRIHANIQVYTP